MCKCERVMMHDQSTDLMDCLDWKDKHKHRTCESTRQHALELIRSGVEIHSVKELKDTCLHLAIRRGFVDVVQLLLEKGINVNAQDWQGDTALHVSCFGDQAQTELVAMLLYHGADPWIQNNDSATPLDLLIKNRYRLEKWHLVATIEHLYYYMFDKYTEFGLSVGALLGAAALDMPMFPEIVKTIKEVDLDDLTTTVTQKLSKILNVDIEHILTMPSQNLKLILDKFDYAFIALFLVPQRNLFPNWSNQVRIENVYILVGSHLQREFIDWLSKWKVTHCFLDSLFKNPVPLASREQIVYYLFSCGMEITEDDIETVYEYCGYKELFKFLRFLDSEPHRSDLRQLIPSLVFEVTGDIQQGIQNPLLWIRNQELYLELDFELVLAYYVVPNLRDMCCDIKGKENLVKKILDQPQIPLLVEMARNVFRKYFVQRLGITSAKQFYQSLELLPISSIHRKIIALETKLY